MNLESELARLESADLVRRATDAELSYQFRHGLTQDTAYSSRLRSKRRDIHRRVAETMEALYLEGQILHAQNRLGEAYAVYAESFERAQSEGAR